jgi:Na+/H+-dicarboxylate symporter
MRERNLYKVPYALLFKGRRKLLKKLKTALKNISTISNEVMKFCEIFMFWACEWYKVNFTFYETVKMIQYLFIYLFVCLFVCLFLFVYIMNPYTNKQVPTSLCSFLFRLYFLTKCVPFYYYIKQEAHIQIN